MSLRKQSPCVKNGVHCDKRHVGCHGECEEYTTWSEERAREREELYRKRTVECQLNDAECKRSTYFNKRKRRRK